MIRKRNRFINWVRCQQAADLRYPQKQGYDHKLRLIDVHIFAYPVSRLSEPFSPVPTSPDNGGFTVFVNVEDFNIVENLYAYLMTVNVSLHERGFESTRFHDFETELTTMRFRSAYTEQIETSFTEITSYVARFFIVYTNTKDVCLFSKKAVDR